MELTSEIIKLRLNVERLLSREEGALGPTGLLPDGEGVSGVVGLDGRIDIENIRTLCGDGAVQRIEDFLRVDIPNPPWSRRTREAQLRAGGNNGVPGSRRKPISRGPGRYSWR